MLLTSRTIAIVLLLTAAAVDASYWVSDFDGSAQEYRVIRNNETIAIEQLMLLQTGDIVVIDRPEGRVGVIDQNEQHLNLTKEDAPFEVPESEAPPQLLINVRHWIASWWSTRGNQNTSSMAAVSKGDLEPTIYASDGEEKFLLEGTRRLHVVWSGGIEPFDVSLFDQSGEQLDHETGLPGFSALLPEVLLRSGQYKVAVAAGGAESSITLTVVGREKLPASAQAILDLDVADEIRFGHLAMLLSAYDSWRFEALQLAHTYNLRQLKLDLLAGNFPASDIDETNVMPGSSDFGRQVLPDNN